MSTTVSMWLGIAFVLIGVAAVVLQAWLWSFPMAADPGGPDPHGRSTAPRHWTHLHRALGLAFVAIYIVMMVEMVPRLWEYQVELPARTVFHAVMGVTIGVLLVTKIAIIRWFQHFGKSLPALGLLIILCTMILATLSVPYALQAHDFGAATTEQARNRVERLMTGLELGDPSELASEDSLAAGRTVLTTKCVVCHDLRTILRRPYPPSGWKRVVERMVIKPHIQRGLTDEDVGPVTAYLVAITPDIQDSVKLKREETMAKAKVVAQAQAAATAPAPAAPARLAGDALVKAKALYEEECALCHELDEVDAIAPQTEAGWREVVQRMIADNDAELADDAVKTIVRYLTQTMGKPPG